MPAKMITYRFFFFEGLLPNLVIITGTVFFPWGPIFEFGNKYRPVFSPGEPFSSQVKMPETGFIPWGAVFESGKKYRKLVAQCLLSIFIHFLFFFM